MIVAITKRQFITINQFIARTNQACFTLEFPQERICFHTRMFAYEEASSKFEEILKLGMENLNYLFRVRSRFLVAGKVLGVKGSLGPTTLVAAGSTTKNKFPGLIN